MTLNLVILVNILKPLISINTSVFVCVAQTLIDLGKDKQNVDEFACAVDEILGDFEFPDEFLYDVWGALTDARPKSS